VRRTGPTKSSLAQIRRASAGAGGGSLSGKWANFIAPRTQCILPIAEGHKRSRQFSLKVSINGYLLAFIPLSAFFGLCPPIENRSINHRYFTNIGQFPIMDGLFGRPRLAYFSGLQIELTSV
jgi:hypothetical protein